jgi:hypothetical protein
MGGAHPSIKLGFQRFPYEGGVNPPRGCEEMGEWIGEGVYKGCKVGWVG